MINHLNNLDILKSQLPKKPYCSNDLNYGLKIQLLDKALQQKYLQINNPAVQHSLIFDLDLDCGFFQFSDKNLPPPNIITKNKKNGRCHYIYQLQAPIYKNRFASLKATKYASAIELAMCNKLEADQNYVGLVSKNPYHNFWQTEIAEESLYELDYLADFVNLQQKPKTKLQNYGLGRNCNLFDDLRNLAYRKKREFDNYEDFFNYLNLQANNFNLATNMNNLLLNNEVKAISRSVAKWTWKNFDVAQSDANFSNLQQYRSNKRNVIKNKNILLNEVLKNG